MLMSATKGRVDWTLVAAAVGLLTLGSIAILSAASPLSFYPQVMHRHFIALGVGALLFVFGLTFNYQIFQDQAKIIYILVIAMLVAVLIVGVVQRGQRSWFALPFISFQPVELARVGTILVLANYLDRRARKIHELSTLFWSLAIVGPVMLLVLKQPDFASMMTFFPILIAMLFCAGVDLRHLLALAGCGGLALAFPLVYTMIQINYPHPAEGSLIYLFLRIPRMGTVTFLAVGAIFAAALVAWKTAALLRMQIKPAFFIAIPVVVSVGLLMGAVANRQLKGYQRNRVVAFLSPQSDRLGASYNVHQSEIAIGSGGLWGKGLFAGTQSQLGFLPERHTDFIYAVIGEEMGLVGTMGTLLLYMLLIGRIVGAARSSRDRYGYLVCCGLATMFGFHLMVNVGMCLGLVPVAGVPLPLVSYGGSNLVVSLWALGITANIYARRFSF